MLGFLISVGAGYLSHQLVGPVARPLSGLIGKFVEVEESELPLLSFMICALAAAILVALFAEIGASAVLVVLGVCLGYFLPRLITRFTKKSEDDS